MRSEQQLINACVSDIGSSLPAVYVACRHSAVEGQTVRILLICMVDRLVQQSNTTAQIAAYNHFYNNLNQTTKQSMYTIATTPMLVHNQAFAATYNHTHIQLSLPLSAAPKLPLLPPLM